ncbi:DAK2 domain-containing protein [Paucilactobacillus wasatchensis]|uniref:Dihydroxyacetone kinase like protein n=1 Tax=Paucilactobacillus wasatchensis TaxID=1335616 RepID=A0A0D0YVX8_9LACO|nr:DAK2 domain-containing protein [Paucilactobacillus wasatchensis]KIS03434.1 Dihydroxyacetone kinase like protein [Paucilactobacillus wasatchensis]
MTVTKITNLEFGQMVQAATTRLTQNAEFINSLNVFPVPDGDTGTNMSMSLASGAKYVHEESSTRVDDLAAALAKGLLMGARGNSGVILSQIFRGFSKGIEGHEALTAKSFAAGYANGAKTAYKAVMKPTEGTILTVVRESAKAGNQAASKSDDLVEVLQAIYEAAKTALKSTPDLLPVLKEVGVVDSGGQGLTFVLQAFCEALSGEISEDDLHTPDNAEMDEMINAEHHRSAQGQLNPADIVYGYCTEIMVRIGRGKEVDKRFDYDEFYQYLAELGDSLLVVNDEEIVKVHVHTEHPGKVLAWGQEFGDLQKVKVDNMRWQQESIMEKDDQVTPAAAPKPEKAPAKTAVIAVSSGDGIGTLFESLGVTKIISGGQTMNPSTEDIVSAIEASGAKEAIVLPNNGNIFMAADQAAQVTSVPTKIVHSKTIAQGMASLLEFNPESTLADNQTAMESNLDSVKSGEVTNAIRDTTIDGVSIKKDDFMGIVDGTIEVTDSKIEATAVAMVKKMLDSDSEIVTIIYGADGDENTAKQIEDAIYEIDDELEVEIHPGGQPVYPYLISVE